jgi:hypothetical protein
LTCHTRNYSVQSIKKGKEDWQNNAELWTLNKFQGC